MELSGQKLLIAYFSRKGENYANGKIVDLTKGNTAAAAEKIAALTGADLFEIAAAKEYSVSYKECTGEAAAELRANARPVLARDLDPNCYDTVILGYPNWCGTMPMAVYTFLEAHDFSRKVILPFCTHEGSGMGNSEQDLRRLLPTSQIRAGLPIRGCMVGEADEALHAWLEKELGDPA